MLQMVRETRMRSKLAKGILVLALLLPVYFAGAALGARFGLFDWRMSLGTLIIQWGPRLLIAVAVLAALSLLLTLFKAPRNGWRSAAIALLIPALGLGYLAWVRGQSADIPPIHDISTRPGDPPAFSPALLALRAQSPDTNPVVSLTIPISTFPKYQDARFAGMGDRSLGAIAAEAYPAVKPLTTPSAPAAAFAAALAEARAQGWEIVTEDAATGTLSATATTFWFGFKDDIAVRVRAEASGSVIDVRSTSRVGLSDLGANAARIEAYLAGVEKRL
jgi:fatty-acyl-CoA synthase